MERNRGRAAEIGRTERASGGASPSATRPLAEALDAALARIEVLERREIALRAALLAHGVDPDAVLARIDSDDHRPHWTAGEPDRPAAPSRAGDAAVREAPMESAAARAETDDPVAVAADAATQSRAARSLAARLAEEVVSGPATLRLRAAARLVDVAGAGAAPALLAAVREAEGAARAALLEQLGRCGAREVAAAVVDFLSDAHPEVRAAAVEAASRLVPEEELEALLRIGIEDADPRVRRRTVLCAAAARSLDAGPMLTGLLADPDRQVRRVVCTALGGSRDPMAALALVGALLDDDAAVRNAAGAAAERLFGEPARGIASLPSGARARAVARLRSWVAANLVRLAPGGRLEPVEAPAAEEVAPAVEDVLDDLMETGHPGAGFEDDVPGWTEANDPELRDAFVRMAGGWGAAAHANGTAAVAEGDADFGDDPTELEREAAALYAAADEAFASGASTGVDGAVGAVAASAIAERLRAAIASGGAHANEERDAEEPSAAEPARDAGPMLDANADSAADAGASAAGVGVREASGADARSGDDEAAGPSDAAPADAERSSAAARSGEAEAARPGDAASAPAERIRGAHPVERVAEAEGGSAAAPSDAREPQATERPVAAHGSGLADAERSVAANPRADGAEAGVAEAMVAEKSAARPEAAVHPTDESAMIESAGAGAVAEGPDFAAIEEVLRASLRGCTDASLAEELGWDEAALAPAIAAHVAAGRLVRRGRKLFLP